MRDRAAAAVAQDFHAAFGLGDDERHISTVDADGVALAAIQGLYEMLRQKDAEIAEQRRRLSAQREEFNAQMAELQRRLGSLERAEIERSTRLASTAD